MERGMRTYGNKPKNVLLDWLTLATYNFKAYTDIAAFLRKGMVKGWKSANWLQYSGFQHGSQVFYGKAMQSNKKEHYIVKVSGGLSDVIASDILDQDWSQNFYATRIDLQVTNPMPDWWHPREHFDEFETNGSKSTLIQSDSGQTLYVGSRKSGRFVRIYEKKFDETYLRFEIELKQGHARRAWELLNEGNASSDVYAAHLARVKVSSSMMDYFTPKTDNELDIRLKERESSNKARMEWLNSLIPTFNKMANDHDIGGRVRAIFETLSVDDT